MNEDLKPCYDLYSLWEMDDYSTKSLQSFHHKVYPNVSRVIDFNLKKVFFVDKERIAEDRIIDINRPLLDYEKKALWIKCQQVMNAEREIEMPYLPEKLTMYVELKGAGPIWYLGILYYKDDTPEKNIIPVKRYFKTDDLLLFNSGLWQEISHDEYMEVTRDVDKNTEQAEISKQ